MSIVISETAAAHPTAHEALARDYVAAQVLVLPAAWNQSQLLVDAVKNALRALPNRKAY